MVGVGEHDPLAVERYILVNHATRRQFVFEQHRFFRPVAFPVVQDDQPRSRTTVDCVVVVARRAEQRRGPLGEQQPVEIERGVRKDDPASQINRFSEQLPAHRVPPSPRYSGERYRRTTPSPRYSGERVGERGQHADRRLILRPLLPGPLQTLLERIEFRSHLRPGRGLFHEFQRFAGQCQPLSRACQVVVLRGAGPRRGVLVPQPVAPLHFHFDLRLPIAEVPGHQVPQHVPGPPALGRVRLGRVRSERGLQRRAHTVVPRVLLDVHRFRLQRWWILQSLQMVPHVSPVEHPRRLGAGCQRAAGGGREQQD